MKSLRESLLDDDLVDKVDNTALMNKLEKGLTHIPTYIKTMEEMMDDFKKNYKQVTKKSEINLDDSYIVFMKELSPCHDSEDIPYISIQIFTPAGQKFSLNRFIYVDGYYYKHINIRYDDRTYFPGTIAKRKTVVDQWEWRYVYKLPEKYEGLLDIIKKHHNQYITN